MAIRGFSINISSRLSEKQATCFAQWIGSSNVIRNQKIREYQALLAQNNGGAINQAYSHIRKQEDLPFLLDIPVQLLRNAASSVFNDVSAMRQGLRQFPKIKNKFARRSVLITQELLLFEPHAHGSILTIFTDAKKHKKKLFSVILPHHPEQLSKQIRITRLGARFSLSGSFDDGVPVLSQTTLLSDYAHLDEAELLTHITGIDRGVVRPLQTSEGAVLTYSATEMDSLRKLAQKKAHYQRILARKKRLAGNKNHHRCETASQKKLAAKITRSDQKIADIRVYFAHRASKSVVSTARGIISLEDLKLKNMLKKAQPKRAKGGRGYLSNQRRAKSGLSRSLSQVALSRLGTFIAYKAADAGKSVIEVNPAYTSRTCHACQSRDTSRPHQALFVCRACGYTGNADENAAKVIAQRAVIIIKETAFAGKAKTPKRIVHRKKKVVHPPLVSELPSG